MHGAPHNFRDEFHRHVFLALGLRVYWGGSALASLLGLGLCVSFFLWLDSTLLTAEARITGGRAKPSGSPLAHIPLAKARHVCSGTQTGQESLLHDRVLSRSSDSHLQPPCRRVETRWSLFKLPASASFSIWCGPPSASLPPPQRSTYPGVSQALQALIRLLWLLLIFLLLWNYGCFPHAHIWLLGFPLERSSSSGTQMCMFAQCLTWFLGLTFPLNTSRSCGNDLRLPTSKVKPLLRWYPIRFTSISGFPTLGRLL